MRDIHTWYFILHMKNTPMKYRMEIRHWLKSIVTSNNISYIKEILYIIHEKHSDGSFKNKHVLENKVKRP